MKNKVTVFALALSIFISPNTYCMLPESPQGFEIFKPEPSILITILAIAGFETRYAMSQVSEYFRTLLKEARTDPCWSRFGLWLDNPEIHSLSLGFLPKNPVIDEENVYFTHAAGPLSDCFWMLNKNEHANPKVILQTNGAFDYYRPVFTDPYIFLVGEREGTEIGRLRVLQRNKENEHVDLQDLFLRFRPNEPAGRGKFLYITSKDYHAPNNFLYVYYLNDDGELKLFEGIKIPFGQTRATIVIDEHDILITGESNKFSIVRQNKDQSHRIFQNLELKDYPSYFTPVVDGEFIYLSYQGGPWRVPAENFYVMRRNQNDEYYFSEKFDLDGGITAPVIVGNTVIVAEFNSSVYFFHRANGSHQLVQKLKMESDFRPLTLVANDRVLFISEISREIIYAFYQDPDGLYRLIRTFKLPGGEEPSKIIKDPDSTNDVIKNFSLPGEDGYSVPRCPALDGDKLYIRGRGKNLVKICFPAPTGKSEDDSQGSVKKKED